TPPQTSQIAILWFFEICEAIAYSVVYPFVNELVKGLDVIGGDDRRVGYYVGLIQSTFYLTECLCVLQWGRLSDVIGRRPVICIALLGVTLSITCFGLSRTFGALILSRSLAGLTSGNIAVIKSAIGGLADSTDVLQAFQYLPLCWNIGQTIGSLIGGYLSNPSQRFPRTFGDSAFWRTYPYLLPCLVAALFPLSGSIASILFLRETVLHPWRWKGWSKVGRSKRDPKSTPLLPHATPAHRSASLLSILTKPVIISVANYCLLAFISMAYSVLQPLFLSTPIQHGGLGLDRARIGYILTAQSAVGALCVLMLSARLQQNFGVNTVFSITMAVFMVLHGAFPVMNALAREDRIGCQVWFILAVQLVLHGLVEIGFGCMIYSSHERLAISCGPWQSKWTRTNCHISGACDRAGELDSTLRPIGRKESDGWQARLCCPIDGRGTWRRIEFPPGGCITEIDSCSGGSRALQRNLSKRSQPEYIGYSEGSRVRF
ncbi:hypothetical protein BS47DRAFT_1458986, partial [Hydnum rufescens UP504]